MGILLQQLTGLSSRLLEQIGVAYKISGSKLRHTPLPHTKKLTGPPNPEIFLCNHESIVRVDEGPQALLRNEKDLLRGSFTSHPGPGLSRAVRGHEHTERLLGASTDPSSQLVQLCQPESFGMFNHHHRRIWNIYPDLDHGCRHEQLNRPGFEGRNSTLLLRRLDLP